MPLSKADNPRGGKMAEKAKSEPVEVKVKTDDRVANLGSPTPASMQALAEDLPENDEVQKAYKASLTTDSAQQEAKEKVKVVKASPDAEETPSGYALVKSAGESNDTERGEKYAREKTARRWGHVPVDE
jgi:hypothetical protein